MRHRRILALTALSAGLLAASAAPAAAAPPVDLAGAYVLDETGVLDGRIPSVEQAIDRLFDAGGAALYVVIVDRFEGSLDSLAWADETAAISGLGDRDALLAIAVDDREYATSVGSAFPASDAELTAAETDALIPELREDRWAEGIIAYADSLTAALTSGAEPGGTPVDGASGGIPIVPIALGVGGAGAIAWFLIARARRKKGPVTAEVEQQSVAELDQSASRRLVQLDDALTTSEQELGFAEAQFGAAPTEGFRTALTQAKSLVADAFRARRELDDENPETDEQKRAALIGIIAACDEADALLEAQEEAFEALRDVEQDLPAALAAVTAARNEAPGALDTAEATVERLRADFGATAIASVVDAPAQARRLLELADAELAEAAANQQGGRTSEAAIDVRSAQLAIAQLTSATAAVERLATELAAARAALAAQQDDLRAGIAAAGALPTSAALASALAAAESTLASADAADPIAALERVVTVDRELDTQLAGAREESERRAKAEAALERTLASARSRILSAAEYVTAHRGAVGADARARLAEAQAQEQIASDTKATDPVGALSAAQRALDLAGQALQSAENDVRATMSPSGPVGGLIGGGRSGGGGGGISEALIGGLIGGLLSGGGGGGFSGGGSSRPRFGSSGGRRPSGGGSSRRSSSGRSSGRRGGGGRF
ncbi:TPM domain-containing protein [Microcella humidisoli]|uniref:TPM domain-containing protein n=1 Tax=Microcella humidisoli TaxID=2963406 RepID=A0ABY5FWM1_9MICO|nr:TPM domain-containing protein [Microcella humidisoli]UTT62684.1 TPM domain-containing protein [Microcella humidisoli]